MLSEAQPVHFCRSSARPDAPVYAEKQTEGQKDEGSPEAGQPCGQDRASALATCLRSVSAPARARAPWTRFLLTIPAGAVTPGPFSGTRVRCEDFTAMRTPFSNIPPSSSPLKAAPLRDERTIQSVHGSLRSPGVSEDASARPCCFPLARSFSLEAADGTCFPRTRASRHAAYL